MADRTVQIKKLEQFGICVSEGIEQFGEEQYFKELEQFVRGQEFLRLGQTVTRAVSYTHLTLPTTPYV